MWSEFWRKDAAGSSKLGFHPSQWTSHPTCHLFPKIGTNETSPRNKVFRLGSNFPRSWRRGWRCSRMWLPLTPCLPLTLRKPPPSTLPQLLPLFFGRSFVIFRCLSTTFQFQQTNFFLLTFAF